MLVYEMGYTLYRLKSLLLNLHLAYIFKHQVKAKSSAMSPIKTFSCIHKSCIGIHIRCVIVSNHLNNMLLVNLGHHLIKLLPLESSALDRFWRINGLIKESPLGWIHNKVYQTPTLPIRPSIWHHRASYFFHAAMCDALILFMSSTSALRTRVLIS